MDRLLNIRGNRVLEDKVNVQSSLGLINRLKAEFIRNFIYKFSLYLTGNTSPLQSPTG
jgi:hypothetical protein